jgi:hypothetical protein
LNKTVKMLPDWQALYADFVEAHREDSFAWGKWDCVMFSDALIKAVTGESIIPKEMKWKTEPEARKAIKAYGKTFLGAVSKAAKASGLKEIPLGFMTQGDLVVYKEESQLCGICDGFYIIGPSDDGIGHKNLDLAIKAFRIDG